MANYHNKKKKVQKKKGKLLKLCLGAGRAIFGVSVLNLGLGVSILGLGSNILGFGVSILCLEGSLFTLGFWQGFGLLALALILRLRTPLASLLTLGHLNLLALVTGLIRPFKDFRRRKRGLGGGRLLRGGGGGSKDSGRRECR